MSDQSDQALDSLVLVVRGNPTPEEIAALVVVIAAGGAAGRPAERTAPTSQWAAYWRSLRAPITPGPGSWRQSARG